MEALSVIDEEYDIISEIKNSNLNKREQIKKYMDYLLNDFRNCSKRTFRL